MSRIERVNVNKYTKVPSDIELQIIHAINKYLSSVAVLGPGGTYTIDRQSIIEDVVQQVYGSMNSISLKLVKEEIEKAINNLLESLDLSDIINTGKYEIISYVKMVSQAEALPTLLIPAIEGIPDVKLDEGRIRIVVNGYEQYKEFNYNFVVDSENDKILRGVLFEGTLLEEDMVVIEWDRTGKDRYLSVGI